MLSYFSIKRGIAQDIFLRFLIVGLVSLETRRYYGRRRGAFSAKNWRFLFAVSLQKTRSSLFYPVKSHPRIAPVFTFLKSYNLFLHSIY